VRVGDDGHGELTRVESTANGRADLRCWPIGVKGVPTPRSTTTAFAVFRATIQFNR
jgi:hypothetical protein